MKKFALLFLGIMIFTLWPNGDKDTNITALYTKIDYILVEKQKRLMSVFYQNKLLKTYTIALGGNPKGKKACEGDKKTPEGIYTISHKNTRSQFYLSLKISYPNARDVKHAKTLGCAPGGDIMIHGLGKGFGHLGKLHTLHDWTLGCIAVTNEEIKEIFIHTPVGTKIEIKP